ncbi:hypothetical protein BKI52_40720 [marine bacterium AO1-C]|nr:hypothetical protein BKI52_40720 [marine bacterium AO1-C]
MNLLNFSQFAWAYTFCQNMQNTLNSDKNKPIHIQLGIHQIGSQLLSSIIIQQNKNLNNDKNKKPHKIIFDVIPQEISWVEMCQRWQQIVRKPNLKEYYVYAPHRNEFFVWVLHQNQLVPMTIQQHYQSRYLPIRFEYFKDTLEVFTTQNQPFLNFKEQAQALTEAEEAIEAYQVALQEKQQLLDQAYQRLDLLEKYYQHTQQRAAS